ncbi:hypothetical protein K461DRAFT_115666 [Myriangium duriaei CBS 260.36]|uniref:CID domain-containing protein n=1 Tax=Myriangium duriaei CBS 260.36 TaxID=1168546 RepID=A0A9P4J3C8_9PEZI|nr:hypothetical protein K461DRAFT_115666 [Myriangium duriaei CBS 260.36]
MESPEDAAGASGKFQDVSDKLNAPKKISQFEKARQEAEQKRLREEQEAERALQEFEDSFAEHDNAGPDGDNAESTFGPRNTGRSNPRSRFDQPYGSTTGPPPSLKRKRELDQLAEERRRSGREDFGSRRHDRPSSDGRQVRLGDDDDDELESALGRHSPEPTVRKPTMLLQLLPGTTTERDIRSIIPSSLKIEDVHFLPSSRNKQDNDRYLSALVSASASTPISDVDKAIGQMQNKYLGFGCYLKISRHVSSTGKLGNIETSVLAMTNKNPFGATQQQSYQEANRPSYREAAPPTSLSRVPPPSNFGPQGSAGQNRPSASLSVSVSAPTDIKLLKLIHHTAEQLIAYGPDFEALLMAQPDIQKDEKWAWLYDSTSQAGIYYRWLIWDHLSGDRDKTINELNIFASGPHWSTPSETPKYASVTCLEQVCEDDDYYSSDEDGADEDTQKRPLPGAPGGQVVNIDDIGNPSFNSQTNYLNPARRAKLTHLLARVPDNIATLRSGDVARVTHFVIHNAGNGAEEITDMLISNLEHPFRYAVKYSDDPPSPSPDESEVKKDRSTAQLIALYLISDVLLTSSTSGVRDAWKYRNLFETALLSRQVFARLGRLERVHSWGRMKAEQWKRKVGVILDLWQAASVFTTDTWRALEKGMWKSAADEGGQKKEEIKRKVEAMKEKARMNEAVTQQQPQRRVRPTAAELNDAPDEKPVVSVGSGFGFALSGSGKGTKGGGMGFSLAPSANAGKKEDKAGPEKGAGGVFGDDSD